MVFYSLIQQRVSVGSKPTKTIDTQPTDEMSARLPTPQDRRKILLVDPNHATFLRLRLILDEAAPEQYTVEWANRFRLGVTQMRRKNYDLCLVASRLGCRSGYDFVETSQQFRPELPLIMLEQEDDRESDTLNEPVWDSLDLDRLHPRVLCNSLREACVIRLQQ